MHNGNKILLTLALCAVPFISSIDAHANSSHQPHCVSFEINGTRTGEIVYAFSTSAAAKVIRAKYSDARNIRPSFPSDPKSKDPSRCR